MSMGKTTYMKRTTEGKNKLILKAGRLICRNEREGYQNI